jgi:hypothetical protein
MSTGRGLQPWNRVCVAQRAASFSTHDKHRQCLAAQLPVPHPRIPNRQRTGPLMV